MGISTISMAMFNSYVSLPKGKTSSIPNQTATPMLPKPIPFQRGLAAQILRDDYRMKIYHICY